MKKTLLMTVSMLVLMTTMSYAYTIGTINIPSITSPYGGTMPQYGSEYVGQIAASLNGVNIVGGMICDDISHNTPVPTTYTVTIETISNLTGAMFYNGSNSTLYKEAAWLNGQINSLSTATQIGEIQFAIWELFASATASAKLTSQQQLDVTGWLAQASTQDFTKYDFSSVEIFTPNNTSNQEFITGSVSLLPHNNPVPEPGTMMLLGFGMLGLAIFGKRRMNKES